MIPNSGLVVHVLSNGVISLWAQWKHALLVMSEITHNFFSVAQQSKSGVGFLIVEVSRSHTHAQLDTHTRQDCSARAINSCRGRYLHNTQEEQEKNTHAFSGIRTRKFRSDRPQTHA